MSQMTGQRRRLDFLRHIVNRVLASSDVPQQIIEDIKKTVGRAEDKYKFDTFSGDIRRLADYIRSRDFEDLINVAKTNPKGLEVVKRILEEAKKAYSDIPEVVEAIESRLKLLGEGATQAREAAKKSLVSKIAEKLREKDFNIIRIDDKAALIEASKDNVKVKMVGIRLRNGGISIDSIEVYGATFLDENNLVDKLNQLLTK